MSGLGAGGGVNFPPSAYRRYWSNFFCTVKQKMAFTTLGDVCSSLGEGYQQSHFFSVPTVLRHSSQNIFDAKARVGSDCGAAKYTGHRVYDE